MKFIDLFAGVGGFHYGIEKAGKAECVYASEWDRYANSVYRKHFGACDQSDIRTVDASRIPDFDLLCGGFPCQSFSIAGKRRGFDDTRGTLFFDIARILKEKQPRLCLLENVKGLLSHDNGRTIKVILTTLVELGYDLQWQVCNSKDFGVPQNRERIFIVGHLRGTPRPQVFPLSGQAETVVSGDFIDLQLQGAQITKQARTIQSRYYKGYSTRYGENSGVIIRADKQDIQQEGDKPDHTDGGRGKTHTAYRQPLKFLQRNQKNIEGDYSFTIDSVNTGGIRQGMAIRRLTPVECERLQGFPDDWTKYGADGELISDTQRYKMMGNAVTTNVIVAIARRLI